MSCCVQDIGWAYLGVQAEEWAWRPLWWAFRGSNPGPSGYEPDALTS